MSELSWTKPEIPRREDIVLRYVMERWEKERPDDPLSVFENGETWTYGASAKMARTTAAAFSELGVKRGDRVACLLPNGPEILKCWFGANWLGAVYAPFNTAYRGSLLAHAIKLASPSIIATHSAFLDRLEEVELDTSMPIILVDRNRGSLPESSLQILSVDALEGRGEETAVKLDHPIEPWETQAIIYTSGTTGPSKGVLSSYCHQGTCAMVAFEEADAPDLRYMITLPLFHAGGTLGVMGMILLGRCFVMVDRFETARFWDQVRATQTTCCTLLGTMETFLLKELASDEDDRNPLKWVYVVPRTAASAEFSSRFGVATRTLFNMSEVSIPIISSEQTRDPASCGSVRAGIELRIADANDQQLADGEVGELLIRADRPWSLSHGYIDNPQATAEAWRNGWFHTGDLFRRSEAGEYYFVDRAKDCIRRRGENISSFEVEQECIAHPQIKEAAAIGVPSEFVEDDLMVVVSATADEQIEPKELFDFLKARSPYFMIPRFIRVLEELPKTPTEKIQKAALRAEGVTPDTWDREAHDLAVKSDRIPRSVSTSR